MLLLLGEVWNKYQVRSAYTAIEELMRMFIFSGFSTQIENFPKTVCGNSHRNAFLLESGGCSRTAWGENIAKVNY